jgi:hypothetical protein
LFCELSFLYSSTRQAWRAVQHKDFEYALRIYQHLADQGSEAAMWNSEQLTEDLHQNSTEWFMLQVAMGFHTALYHLGERKFRNGEIEEAKKIWKSTASKEVRSAFRYGWANRDNFSESIHFLNMTLNKRHGSFLLIYPMMFLVFIINIPSFIVFGVPDELKTLFHRNIDILLSFACFIVLYFMISQRLIKTIIPTEF